MSNKDKILTAYSEWKLFEICNLLLKDKKKGSFEVTKLSIYSTFQLSSIDNTLKEIKDEYERWKDLEITDHEFYNKPKFDNSRRYVTQLFNSDYNNVDYYMYCIDDTTSKILIDKYNLHDHGIDNQGRSPSYAYKTFEKYKDELFDKNGKVLSDKISEEKVQELKEKYQKLKVN